MKISKIQSVLNHYFPNPPCPLNNVDDFTFLCSVVLSAQTTDGKVNKVTKELFALAPSAFELSKLSPADVERLIKPVGLSSRKSHHLVGLSQAIVSKFNGKVPSTYEELESLPGVGHKTASVVMSQLFGEPAFAVDTHVHRLALRWGLSSEEKNVKKVQEDLCKSFPQSEWSKVHLQMIYFGREFCTAKSHQNSACPMCSFINSKVDEMPQLQSFSPQKKTKGIVYYSDRIDELMKNPTLVPDSSPGKPLSKSKSIQDEINHEELLVNNELDISDSFRGKRKRATSKYF